MYERIFVLLTDPEIFFWSTFFPAFMIIWAVSLGVKDRLWDYRGWALAYWMIYDTLIAGIISLIFALGVWFLC